MNHPDRILKDLKNTFETVYGNSENVRYYFAPGRVNLIGEHIDYNGGCVFPCAISAGTYAAARKREDGQIRIFSANFAMEGIKFSSLDDLRPGPQGTWTNYIRGMVKALQDHLYEIDKGIDLALYGTIPSGAGLSSSASLEVVTGYALLDLFHLPVMGQELALLGQECEREYCGVNCGIMDQFAVAMAEEGQAIRLNTSTLAYEYVPLRLASHSIVITNTHVTHSLAGSEYNVRRNQCEQALKDLQEITKIPDLCSLKPDQFDKLAVFISDPVCRKRAKHAVYENDRTARAVEALKENSLETFGRLMNESHISLRDDYETSCPEADLLAETAWTVPGVLGSRITGGGFGGCTVSIVEKEAVPVFKETLLKAFREKTGTDCSFYEEEAGGGPAKLQEPAD